MILKYLRNTLYISTAVIYIILLISSCRPDSKKADVSGVQVHMDFLRFERDLFESDPNNMAASIASLRSKYGSFFDLFAFQVTRLGSRDSLLMQQHFHDFIADTNFRAVYKQCEKTFGDFSPYEQELTKAFQHYSYHLPGKTVPKIVTLLSAFSYPVICDSTHLGISLDMYLGSDYPMYNTLEPALPNYLRIHMRPEYVVSDAMKGWIQSDYSIDDSQSNLIEQMVSEGRILTCLGYIFPDLHDSITSGFSSAQLKWCENNERMIWSFFVENKILFTKEPSIMMKYVGEGPTTNGFPKESPGNIGQYIGWRIVNSYMKNHPEISLRMVMEEKNLSKIFQESKYKPKK